MSNETKKIFQNLNSTDDLYEGSFYRGSKKSFVRVGYELPVVDIPDADIKSVMDFRHNIKFFDHQKIPSKESIDDILTESHKYIPHKNNLLGIKIKIYGPEYKKDKDNLVLATVCGPSRSEYVNKNGKHYGDIDLLKKRYSEWKTLHEENNIEEKKEWKETFGLNFNEQVTAPYLISFTKRIRIPTVKQKSLGVRDWVWNKSLNENSDYKWHLAAGIHSYGITLLAAERGIYASYCRCFKINIPNLHTKCLEDAKENSADIIFLGLGYRNYNVPYFVDENKADKEEYIFWQ